eukprot:scaffold4454_cov411-Prasinococcus_capsulatus_cf.AAC.14
MSGEEHNVMKPIDLQAQRISVTIRTIISGMCYLSISVFAFNSIGLFLYAGQLAMNPEQPKPAENSESKEESEQTGTGQD